MNDDRWIVVPNWDKFQHYSDRNPPWIKLYLELERKPEWVDLTDAERGLLVRVWIGFAGSRGGLRVSDVRRQGWGKHTASQLESLNHAGFITFSDSRPLSPEKSREEKKVLSIDTQKPATTTTGPRVNAGAYKPFHDESRDAFDEEAFIAEVSRKASAKGWVPPT